MVYVVDLENGGCVDKRRPAMQSIEVATHEERPYENTESRFTAILACYPVLASLATCLDLNSLDSLSKTCRLARYNIIPYTKTLSRKALRCHNSVPKPEKWTPALELRDAIEGLDELAIYDLIESDMIEQRRLRCASDLVRPCRKCSTIVCRNCFGSRPVIASTFGNRLRRLCKTCADAPLMAFTHPAFWSSASSSQTEEQQLEKIESISTSNAFARGVCECVADFLICEECQENMTRSDAGYKSVWRWRRRYTDQLSGIGIGVGEGIEGVSCAMGTKCLGVKSIEVEVECNDNSQPRDLYNQTHAPTPTRPSWIPLLEDKDERADTYTHNGFNGQTSMRPSPPLAHANFLSDSPASQHIGSQSSDPYPRQSYNAPQQSYPFRDDYARAQNPTPPPEVHHEQNGDVANTTPQLDNSNAVDSFLTSLQSTSLRQVNASKYPSRTGYFSQEVEGIGGTLQRKCKRIQRVANTVPQYADEKDGGSLMGREFRGEKRAWCAWCDRVVPAKYEELKMKK